jgi:hypothetical protein
MDFCCNALGSIPKHHRSTSLLCADVFLPKLSCSGVITAGHLLFCFLAVIFSSIFSRYNHRRGYQYVRHVSDLKRYKLLQVAEF